MKNQTPKNYFRQVNSNNFLTAALYEDLFGSYKGFLEFDHKNRE
jgi:hypothetical protein